MSVPADSVSLRIALLGPPLVERDGVPVQVDTRKAIGLVAYLVVTGQPQTRDSLVATFWPDYDQSRARAALRRTLSALNKGLGGGGLRTGQDFVQLERPYWTDVGEFASLIEDADAHGHDPQEPCPQCIDRLERAAALHRGDFMAGFGLRDSPEFDDWQFFQAERFRRDLGGTLNRLTSMLGAAGRTDDAVEYARQWLRLDPLNEPAHRRLMTLYARAGERAAALRQYRDCVEVLDRELGVAPLDETTAVHDAIKQDRLPSPMRPAAAPVAAPRPPASLPFVGRDVECRTILAVYEEVGPDGRLVVLEGEAGIGKTRLSEEVASEVAGRGGLVLRAHCYEDEAGLAYGPIVQLLEAAVGRPQLADVPATWLAEASRLVPELAQTRPDDLPLAVDGPGAQTRFVHGVSRVIQSAAEADGPGVLLLDDLQWADEASLEVLSFLLHRLRGHPILVLALWRTEEVPSDHRLHRIAGRLDAEGLGHTLRLGRLGPAEVEQLVRSAQPDAPPDLAGRLYEETEGLPFFLTEYLAQPSHGPDQTWTLPGGARELVHARLAPLSGTAAQVLSTGAVIGRSFDLDTVIRASGRSEEETVTALEELIGRGLVIERSSGYDFVHEKIRTAAYERTSLARRRVLHRRVAEALASSPRMDTGRLDALVAHHYVLAGRPSEAAEFYAAAGDHARGLHANAEALEHYQSALAAGHPDPLRLWQAIGDLRTLRAEYGDAVEAYESAAAAAHSDEDLSELEHKLGGVYLRRADWETADAHLVAALQILPDDDLITKARILADRSLTASHRGLDEQAEALGMDALALAEEAGAPAALAQALNILGVLLRRQGDVDTAGRHLEHSLEIAEHLDDPGARTAALNNLALVEATAGRSDRALELLRTALGVCALQGDRHREAAIHNNLADVLRGAGRTEDAMSHLKQAVAIFADIGEPGESQPEIWKLVDW